MSWSIYLSGNKEDVQRELDSAIAILGEASEQLQSSTRPLVNITANGSSYQNDGGDFSVSNSYSVSGSYPAPPPPPQEEVANEPMF
jgi:hypothetical protein